MHIKDIYIDGFGIYNDFRLSGLTKGINVVIGNNEAGKSTLHRFIRYTLFGYPRFRDRRMPPVRGGAHGGRIIAEIAGGDELVVDRKGNGRLSVIAGHREFGSDTELVRLLGNTTESIYNKVYAFTLDELVSLDSLAESGVEDKIFSIGMGLGDISLSEIEDEIGKYIDQFHKPGGRGRLIGDYLKRIGEIKEEVTAKQALLPKRRELKEQLEKLQEESSSLLSVHREKSAAAGRLENLLKCHASYVKYRRAIRELEDTPAPRGFPDKGIEILDKLEEKREELSERMKEIHNGTANDKGIPELKELADNKGYNHKLTEESGRVEYMKSNLSMYSSLMRDFRRDDRALAMLREELSELLTGIDRSWTLDTLAGLQSGAIHRSAVVSFISSLDEIKKRRIAAEAHAAAARSASVQAIIRRVAALISAVLLIASITVFYYSLPVAGGTLVLAALVVYAGTRIAVAGKHSGKEEYELENLQKEEKKIKSSYENYFSERIGIAGQVPPESALQLLDGIDRCFGILKRIRELESAQEERKSFFSKYEPVVLSLAQVAGLDENTGNENIELLANIITEKFLEADEKRRLSEMYSKELASRQREAENTRKRLEEVDAEIAELFQGSGASDSDDFRNKGMADRKVKALMEEINRASGNIEAIMGAGKLDDVLEWFDNSGIEQTEAGLIELKQICSNLEEKIKEHNVRTGEIMGEITRIEEKADMAASATALETGKNRLAKMVSDWIAGRIAIELLSEVRFMYEEEKQPAVINNAAGYFSKVTGGAYNRLHVSSGSRDVRIYGSDGDSRTTGELSRGTREQLLICLRLGFIEEYERSSEPLPMMTDEVLVNFDQERAESMAGLFFDFCRDRQMLLFSCHPATAELFKGQNINVINIES